MSGNNNDTTLILVLLAGAYMMTRRPMVGAVPAQYQQPGKLNSLPGNIGTGVGQALGGALGNLIGSWFKPSAAPANNGAGANGSTYYDFSDVSSGSSTDWTAPGISDPGDQPWYETLA